MNNAMNTDVQVSVSVLASNSFAHIPRSRITGSENYSVFNFLRSSIIFKKREKEDFLYGKFPAALEAHSKTHVLCQARLS